MSSNTSELDGREKYFNAQGMQYKSILHFGPAYSVTRVEILECNNPNYPISVTFDSTVSVEDTLMIVEAVSSGSWILNLSEQKTFLAQDVIARVRFLQSQGVNPEVAINPAKNCKNFGIKSTTEFMQQFHEFVEVGCPITLEPNRGTSNLELYLRLRKNTDKAVADRILSLTDSDINSFQKFCTRFNSMLLHKDSLKYVAKFNLFQFQMLFSIHQTVHLLKRRTAVTISRMISEVGPPDLNRIARLAKKFETADRVDDVLYWNEVELFNSLGRYRGLARRLDEFDEGSGMGPYVWATPLATLIILYGVKRLDTALSMISNASYTDEKNFALLIVVLKYLESNSETVYPLEWIVELNEDYYEG